MTATELASHIEELDRYDTIFLGFPNWWGDMPMAVYSFLAPGHVAQMAAWIQAGTGGDLFSIVTADPYSSDYDECLDRAADEKATPHRGGFHLRAGHRRTEGSGHRFSSGRGN